MKESDNFQINTPRQRRDTLAMMTTDGVGYSANAFPLNRYDSPIIGKNIPKAATFSFFLQDYKTKKFMRCDSTWTNYISEALDFLSTSRAICFGMKELKTAFQILQIAPNMITAPAEMVISQLPQLASSSATRTAYEEIVLNKTCFSHFGHLIYWRDSLNRAIRELVWTLIWVYVFVGVDSSALPIPPKAPFWMWRDNFFLPIIQHVERIFADSPRRHHHFLIHGKWAWKEPSIHSKSRTFYECLGSWLAR